MFSAEGTTPLTDWMLKARECEWVQYMDFGWIFNKWRISTNLNSSSVRLVDDEVSREPGQILWNKCLTWTTILHFPWPPIHVWIDNWTIGTIQLESGLKNLYRLDSDLLRHNRTSAMPDFRNGNWWNTIELSTHRSWELLWHRSTNFPTVKNIDVHFCDRNEQRGCLQGPFLFETLQPHGGEQVCSKPIVV
jgi:hypothetical protein